MHGFGLTFHHFGIAVPRPEAAFAFLAGLGYREGKSVFDPGQGVNVAMRHHSEMPDAEVIWPAGVPSPIDSLVKRRRELLYHLCYAAPDAADTLAKLESTGHEILQVIPATPAPLFGGLDVSFHIVRGVGLIELIHGDPKRCDSI